MLVDYWELQSAPFHSPTGAGFFASASSDEAAARLQFLVENRHRLGVLIGESGCGKTVLLDKFQQDLRLHACEVLPLQPAGH